MTLTGDTDYLVARSATLELTTSEVAASNDGPVLIGVDDGPRKRVDTFASGLVSVRGVRQRRKAFVLIGGDEHRDATDDELIMLAKPLLDEALA